MTTARRFSRTGDCYSPLRLLAAEGEREVEGLELGHADPICAIAGLDHTGGRQRPVCVNREPRHPIESWVSRIRRVEGSAVRVHDDKVWISASGRSRRLNFSQGSGSGVSAEYTDRRGMDIRRIHELPIRMHGDGMWSTPRIKRARRGNPGQCAIGADLEHFYEIDVRDVGKLCLRVDRDRRCARESGDHPDRRQCTRGGIATEGMHITCSFARHIHELIVRRHHNIVRMTAHSEALAGDEGGDPCGGVDGIDPQGAGPGVSGHNVQMLPVRIHD